jgi:hypothetical protein
MHRWVRGITVGAGGVAVIAASFGAGLSPAGAQTDDDPDADADADAVVWNDQFATVEVTNDGQSSTGDNEATSLSGNLVIIGQGADASADLLSESRDEILEWFFSEGFADWSGVGWLVDSGFSVIPGTPVVLPVLGGSATNLIESINQSATGIATIVSGSAAVDNTTGVDLSQDFSGNEGATATADATSGSGAAESEANAEVGNSQGAGVFVDNNGTASSGGNRATTVNGNAAIIGQGASAGAGAEVNGNAGSESGGGGGSVTGGTASNTVGSVTNTASGEAAIETGDASVSNSTNVSVTQSNSGNGGATATATATGPAEPEPEP